MTVEQQMRTALLNYGAINDNWHIAITDIENLSYSDWAKVTVLVRKPRCRKPFMEWTLFVDTVRGITDFARNTFIYLT